MAVLWRSANTFFITQHNCTPKARKVWITIVVKVKHFTRRNQLLIILLITIISFNIQFRVVFLSQTCLNCITVSVTKLWPQNEVKTDKTQMKLQNKRIKLHNLHPTPNKQTKSFLKLAANQPSFHFILFWSVIPEKESFPVHTHSLSLSLCLSLSLSLCLSLSLSLSFSPPSL